MRTQQEINGSLKAKEVKFARFIREHHLAREMQDRIELLTAQNDVLTVENERLKAELESKSKKVKP